MAYIQVSDGFEQVSASVENPISSEVLDQFYCKSSEKMVEIPDNSVHLVVTSPPYNVQKEYELGGTSSREHLNLLMGVFSECMRVLVVGGRICINVANIGRKPYFPLSSMISTRMIELGYNMRGEIIWNKAASVGTSTAWGSWQSATNPILRDTHEYILVFSKGSYKRERPRGKDNTITSEEFTAWTKSIWDMKTESASRVGHPAPYPIELPHRLIRLYSFSGDIILDPFVGSGTTAIAACRNGRHFIGYDTEEKYLEIARQRLERER